MDRESKLDGGPGVRYQCMVRIKQINKMNRAGRRDDKVVTIASYLLEEGEKRAIEGVLN